MLISTAGERVRSALGTGGTFSLVVAQAFPEAPATDVPGIVERAREQYGFQSFEIVPATDPGTAERIGRSLRSGGSRAVFLAGLPLLRARATLSGDAAARTRAIRAVQEVVALASAAGAEAVMVTSGPRDPGMRESDQLSAFAESLVELAHFASREAPGVRIRIEPTDTDVQHRQLVGGTALTIALVDQVARQGEIVDVNLDLSHILQLGEAPAEALRIAQAVCRHVHLANCVLIPGHELYGDRHPPFGVPGSSVDLTELADALGTLRTLGYLDEHRPSLFGLEVKPPGGTDGWDTLDHAVRDLAQAFDRQGSPDRKGGVGP